MNFTRTRASTLFEDLKPYRYVLVTGPHRAGTTITAAMIANDLGYECYEEPEISTLLGEHNHAKMDYRRFLAMHPEPAVIHCPSHCAFVHRYADVEGLVVVLVRRPVRDIIASQRRVGWGFAAHELKNYPGASPPVAMVKYEYWDRVQRPVLGSKAWEIDYRHLAAHPMWVPKRHRRGWAIAQIEPGLPRGAFTQNQELAG